MSVELSMLSVLAKGTVLRTARFFAPVSNGAHLTKNPTLAGHESGAGMPNGENLATEFLRFGREVGTVASQVLGDPEFVNLSREVVPRSGIARVHGANRSRVHRRYLRGGERDGCG